MRNELDTASKNRPRLRHAHGERKFHARSNLHMPFEIQEEWEKRLQVWTRGEIRELAQDDFIEQDVEIPQLGEPLNACVEILAFCQVMLLVFGREVLAFESREKCANLEARLEYLKSKFNIEGIVEEWSDKKDSCAKHFALKTSLHWANVGTPDEPQFQTYSGLIHYPGHNGTLPHDPDAPSLDEYGPFENQEKRENWMVRRVEVEMANYTSGLFIIGIAHMHSLVAKLRAAGFHVTAYTWLS